MTGKKVIVNDGNAEKALRKFKKMIAEINTYIRCRWSGLIKSYLLIGEIK